jgi:hypothetical protein
MNLEGLEGSGRSLLEVGATNQHLPRGIDKNHLKPSVMLVHVPTTVLTEHIQTQFFSITASPNCSVCTSKKVKCKDVPVLNYQALRHERV